MEFVGLTLAAIWFAGALAEGHKLRRQAGIMHNRKINFSEDGVGPVWLVRASIQVTFWPIFLIARIARRV